MNWFENLLEQLHIKLNFSRKNSPNINSKTELKIAQVNYSSGLSQEGAIALVDTLVNQRLTEFTNVAEQTYIERTKDLKKMLGEQILKLNASELDRLKDPDVQLAIADATRVMGRKSQVEYQKILGLLVVNKLKTKDENRDDLRNIVYNEAINTLAKLTTNQIKIIALSYLAGHVTFSGIDSWEAFVFYFRKMVIPLLDYVDSQTDFAHIAYSGCGSITLIGKLNYIELFRDNYSFLFEKSIDAKLIDELKLPETLISELMTYKKDTSVYIIDKVRNISALEKLLAEHEIKIDQKKSIVTLYKSNLYNYSEIQAEVSTRLPELAPYLNAIQKTSLSRLSVTSVGIMIAISYIEQLTGVKLDTNKWIN